MNADDARLIALVRAGDEAAFEQLVATLYRPLRSLVSRFVDGATIDDIMQQTWLSMLEGLAQFEGRSRLSTWVLQIGLNRARQVARSQGTEAPWPDDEELPEARRFTTVGSWLTPPLPWRVLDDRDPEVLAGHREVLRALERALPRLPETQRVAVTLRDVEGLELAEVAQVLDLTEGNLRVVLHRGRARLRDVLEAEFGVAVTSERARTQSV